MRQGFARRQNYKYWAFGAIGLGTFGTVVDHGSVNIAVPVISEDFGANLSSAQWVVISFALTISALLLPLGRLVNQVGRTRMYIAGSVVFIVGAALAGAAPNLTILILARVLQGVGAAMTQGTGMAIISSVFPANERGKAIGLLMTVVGIGAVAGPAVGGILISLVDWRLVFFINVPLGLLGIAACLVVLNDPDEKGLAERARNRGFDWLGAVLSSGMLVTFILTITNGQRVGWGSPPILLAWWAPPPSWELSCPGSFEPPILSWTYGCSRSGSLPLG